MFLKRKAAFPAAEVNPKVADVKPRLELQPCRISDAWAGRGASQPDNNVLQERTVKWLAALPADVWPTATAQQYPRIVNRIDDLWGSANTRDSIFRAFS